MKGAEHELQKACVRWFTLQYPEIKDLLIAIPNGGQRNVIVAAKLKAEGAKAGVPDLVLAVPDSPFHWEHAGLWIEMKTAKGRLQPSQKEYLKKLAYHGYAVAVCRSFDEFRATVKQYLIGAHQNDAKLTQ